MILAFLKPSDISSERKEFAQFKDLVPIIKQNNYTNLHLQIVGKQLTGIEESVVELVHNHNQQVKSSSDPPIQPVNVKPPLEVTNFKLRTSKQDNELMNPLIQKIKNISIG